MAFSYFAENKVDVAIIEVGLGGRLDSTNIIDPLLSIITSISLDHMDVLGNNIISIATEKAGIIKNASRWWPEKIQPKCISCFVSKPNKGRLLFTWPRNCCNCRGKPSTKEAGLL
jgi:dihydrofolate synthase/folylpolyglutamate synthase